jgi:outer membrane biosynthesis protein TonB
MPSRRSRPALAAALLLAASLLLAACGDDNANPELLPPKQAEYLLENLDDAQTAFDDDDCTTALAHLQAVQDRINLLGKPISHELKLNLREGAATLYAQAEAECGVTEEPATEEPTPEPTPAPEPEPEPTTTDQGDTTPPEDNQDQPDQQPTPEPEPTPTPTPEPTPTPTPEPTPTPQPTPAPPGPGSGGISPNDQVGN